MFGSFTDGIVFVIFNGKVLFRCWDTTASVDIEWRSRDRLMGFSYGRRERGTWREVRQFNIEKRKGI